jgi:hypothetical protein
MSEDLNGFWNTWRSNFSKSQPSTVIDSCCNDESVANRFADVFSAICVPNTESRHVDLCENFLHYMLHMNIRSNNHICIELVRKCIAGLKRGKAAGLDGLTVEHVAYSHPVLITHLITLFNVMLTRCIWTGNHYTIGKNTDGNKIVSVNHRSITLSPVISNFFESVLLEMRSK